MPTTAHIVNVAHPDAESVNVTGPRGRAIPNLVPASEQRRTILPRPLLMAMALLTLPLWLPVVVWKGQRRKRGIGRMSGRQANLSGTRSAR